MRRFQTSNSGSSNLGLTKETIVKDQISILVSVQVGLLINNDLDGVMAVNDRIMDLLDMLDD